MVLAAGSVIYLLNRYLNGDSQFWSVASAMTFGNGLGVIAGVGALNNRYLSPYPARTFAVIFIFFAGVFFLIEPVSIVWQLIDKQTDEPHFIERQFLQMLGGTVAIGTAWWALWLKRGDLSER